MTDIPKTLDEWLRFFRSQAHVLQRRPQLLFQQAANQPDSTAPARAARRRLATSGDPGPWIDWLNRPQADAPCITLQGHRGMVTRCSFSPDGRRLLTAGEDGTVQVWEVDSGRLTTTLCRFPRQIADLALASDGQRLVVSIGPTFDRGAIELLDPRTGESLRTLGADLRRGGHLVRFAPDGSSVAIAGDSRVTVVSPDTGQEVWAWKDSLLTPRDLAFAPGGHTIAIAAEDRLLVQDAASGRTILQLAGRAVLSAMAWSPDRTLVAAGFWQQAAIWDTSTGGMVRAIHHRDRVTACAFSPDGLRIATASEDRTVVVREVASGTTFATLEVEAEVLGCAFSPDGKRIALGARDGTVSLWNPANGSPPRVVTRLPNPAFWVAFCPGGDALLALAAHALEIRDLASGGLRPRPPEPLGEVHVAAWTPDGARIVTGHGDGSVRAWQAATGGLVSEYAGHAYLSALSTGAGGLVAVASVVPVSREPKLDVWNSLTGAVRELRGYSPHVAGLAFSPDRTRVFVLGTFGDLACCDATTGEPISQVQLELDRSKPSACGFAPDGRRLASGDQDGSVRVWDLAERRPVATLQGHFAAVTACRYAPDGRLATASNDGTVRVWDPDRATEPAVLAGHTRGVTDVAWAPDGRRIVSTSSDGSARIWDLSAGVGPADAPRLGWRRSLCELTPDGERLISVDRVSESSFGPGATEATIWDTATGSRRHVITLSNPSVLCAWLCACAPEGVFALFMDEQVSIRSVETAEEVATLQTEDQGIRGLVFSPDGRLLAVSTQSGIELWEVGARARTAQLPVKRPVAAAFAPDGSWIAGGGDEGIVRIWDTGTGRLMHSLEKHQGRVTAIAVARDGRRLVSGADSGKSMWVLDDLAKVWDTTTGREIATLRDVPDNVYGCRYSPDGSRFLTWHGSHAHAATWVWNAASLHLEQRIARAHDAHFSPDGRHLVQYLASYLVPAQLTIWRLDTGREVGCLPLPIQFATGWGPSGQLGAVDEGGRVLVLRATGF